MLEITIYIKTKMKKNYLRKNREEFEKHIDEEYSRIEKLNISDKFREGLFKKLEIQKKHYETFKEIESMMEENYKRAKKLNEIAVELWELRNYIEVMSNVERQIEKYRSPLFVANKN